MSARKIPRRWVSHSPLPKLNSTPDRHSSEPHQFQFPATPGRSPRDFVNLHRCPVASRPPTFTTMRHFRSTPLPVRFTLAVLLSLAAFALRATDSSLKTRATVALAIANYEENPGSDGDGEFTVGPHYTTDPDLTDRGNPKGKSFEFKMKLTDSKIFPGDDKTLQPDKKPVNKERKIFVYVPAAYKDGTAAPYLIIHDGPGQLNSVRHALDNLTLSKDPRRQLPAFIAIAVQNGGNDGKKSERGLEYDTMSDREARFIAEEVIPAVLANADLKSAYPHVTFTTNPWGHAVMGCSSGGAAALIMGWSRPDLFRRVIAYSGTFVAQQDDDAPERAKYPLGAWEFHSGLKLIEKSAPKPLRIFTHCSENDNGAQSPEEGHHNWVIAGQRTSAALTAKRYHHRFVFSKATGHCDGKIFNQTLADTLVWLWRGYHAE